MIEYEETFIEGALHFRLRRDGKWKPASLEVVNKRLVDLMTGLQPLLDDAKMTGAKEAYDAGYKDCQKDMANVQPSNETENVSPTDETDWSLEDTNETR